jgi:hypothetical protein
MVKKIALTIIFGIGYMIIGILLDKNKFITHPALWSLYGALFACVYFGIYWNVIFPKPKSK